MNKAVLKSFTEMPATLRSITSYAAALTAAIRRFGPIAIGANAYRPDESPKLIFSEVHGSHMVDYVHTGRHTIEFSLEGTSKRYRVMIEPIKETHRGKK